MAKYKKQFLSLTEYFLQAWINQDFKTLRSYLHKDFYVVAQGEVMSCGDKLKEVQECFYKSEDENVERYHVYQIENPTLDPDLWKTLVNANFTDNQGSETLHLLFHWNEDSKLNSLFLMY